MLRINLTDASNTLYWHDAETEQELTAWLNNFIGKKNFLPERYQPTYDENGKPVLDDNGEQVLEFLPKEYTTEIKDLSLDVEFMAAKINEKRKKEYPEINDVIEALLEVHEGRPEKLTEIMLKREAIKIKYPKGVK